LGDVHSDLSPVNRNVGAVILAAGPSTRLGYSKQLIIHEGEPLVRRAAIAAAEAGASPVIVVLGAEAEQITSALALLPSVTLVMNDEWQSGLASSLAAGLRALFQNVSCDGALVMLADQPLIDVTALRQLLDAFNTDDRIIASEYDDTIGVPVVIGREHVPELLALKGDAGAGAWLRKRIAQVTRIPMARAAVDVDTPSDAERLAHDGRRKSGLSPDDEE
jgi:CTP:molybdopterin cytidylyltransferase MocA